MAGNSLKIAKYLRISAEDIDLDGLDKFESNSIQHQRALIDDFIANTPEFSHYEVIEELDDGRTGTNFMRPGAKRLIEMAEKGEVHVIICKDLSRWGRSYIEVGDFLEQKFPAWGVRFISINEGFDSGKLNGQAAGIDIAFRNLIHEIYSRDLSEKVRQGRVTATKNGKCTTSIPLFGYLKVPLDKRKLIIDEPAAEVVRHIFDLAELGNTPQNIAKMLNDEGVPSPNERRKKQGLLNGNSNGKYSTPDNVTFWSGSMVRKIILDTQYTGKIIYGKTRSVEVGKDKLKKQAESDWVVAEDAIPVIISEERFASVNDIMAKTLSSNESTQSQISAVQRYRERHENVTKAPLFKGIIKCGQCGMALRSYGTKDGIKYYCATPTLTSKYMCHKERIYEQDIAEIVLMAVHQQIDAACNISNNITEKSELQKPKAKQIEQEIEHLVIAIEKAKTAKMSLWEKYHTKEIDADVFRSENTKADEQIKAYNEELTKLRLKFTELHYVQSNAIKEDIIAQKFTKHSGLQELTREVVTSLVKEIKIFSADRIEIVFNFEDEFSKM